MTSHSVGWIARVYSSLRSCRSRCSSTRHSAPTRDRSVRSARSAEATGDAAGAAYATEASLVVGVVARVAAEDVVERRAGAEPRLQRGRRALGAHAPAMQERDAVAQAVRLV